MIISDEQVRKAAEYLRAPHDSAPAAADSAGVPGELVDRIRASVDGLPDVRADRVAQAREMLAHRPSSEEVAGKLIGRAVSDSLR